MTIAGLGRRDHVPHRGLGDKEKGEPRHSKNLVPFLFVSCQPESYEGLSPKPLQGLGFRLSNHGIVLKRGSTHQFCSKGCPLVGTGSLRLAFHVSFGA